MLGLERERIWKTLVVRGDRTGPLFALIPIAATLDLKALARLAGDKRVEMLPLKEVLAHTGYVRGAVTALGAKRAYPVFVDAASLALDRFGVSAGALGMELLLAPADYVRATGARVGAIVEPA